MKRTSINLLAIALFFTLTSEKCDKDAGAAGSSSSAVAQMPSIIGTKWNLSTLAGEAIRLPEGIENPYLDLLEGGRLTGFGGCNKLMGSVKMEGTAISFPGLGSTKMFCEKSQALESAFLTALRVANTYKAEGDKLTLLDKSKELATLVKK